MQVSVLGFDGSEIGLEGAEEAIVAQLLGNALDAGLNVIDTGECHGESENLIGKQSAGGARNFISSPSAGILAGWRAARI